MTNAIYWLIWGMLVITLALIFGLLVAFIFVVGYYAGRIDVPHILAQDERKNV